MKAMAVPMAIPATASEDRLRSRCKVAVGEHVVGAATGMLAAGELVVGAAIGMLVVEDWVLGEVCTDSEADEDAAPNKVVDGGRCGTG